MRRLLIAVFGCLVASVVASCSSHSKQSKFGIVWRSVNPVSPLRDAVSGDAAVCLLVTRGRHQLQPRQQQPARHPVAARPPPRRTTAGRRQLRDHPSRRLDLGEAGLVALSARDAYRHRATTRRARPTIPRRRNGWIRRHRIPTNRRHLPQHWLLAGDRPHRQRKAELHRPRHQDVGIVPTQLPPASRTHPADPEARPRRHCAATAAAQCLEAGSLV